MSQENHPIHISINHVKHEVRENEMTGQAIKSLGGIPEDHVLCEDAEKASEHHQDHPHEPHELRVIEDHQRVKLVPGLRFYSLAPHECAVTVTIDGKEYVFKHAKQTGKKIKERAGIPLADVLFLQEAKEDRVITDEECITLKCGDCFHSAPPANYGHTGGLPDDFSGGQVLLQPDGWRFVVFDNYALPDGFSAKSVRLLVKLAPNFPDAAPDMFWVHPEIRTASNVVPQGTSLENVLGQQWQRFSWHLQAGAWKIGASTLRDFLRCVRARFEKRN